MLPHMWKMKRKNNSQYTMAFKTFTNENITKIPHCKFCRSCMKVVEEKATAQILVQF